MTLIQDRLNWWLFVTGSIFCFLNWLQWVYVEQKHQEICFFYLQLLESPDEKCSDSMKSPDEKC